MIYIVDRTPERAECWRQILRRQMLFARVVPWSELSPAPDARVRGCAPTDAEAVLLSTAGCSASDAETVRRCFSVRPLCPTPEEVFVPSFGSIDRPNAPEEGAETGILRCPDS
ncbi:MAG: hypothetical protein J6125_03645, partial [Clostridia bacterium]|nr:hypothetical protein [Clostridia bacterium]